MVFTPTPGAIASGQPEPSTLSPLNPLDNFLLTVTGRLFYGMNRPQPWRSPFCSGHTRTLPT
ncbi:hypothetical protein NG796_23885 [Laspinema sp. A4]|uniref:hypothetical protein n=1 Tax=Laspinema sp. D2d TaxID=2953686 RepID=UPI0021BB88BC|nr:hypothetical protein [Laspinema sp. D2d]MCT7986317.1 hypothetical protein [Laspinema sp. D2d]